MLVGRDDLLRSLPASLLYDVIPSMFLQPTLVTFKAKPPQYVAPGLLPIGWPRKQKPIILHRIMLFLQLGLPLVDMRGAAAAPGNRPSALPFIRPKPGCRPGATSKRADKKVLDLCTAGTRLI